MLESDRAIADGDTGAPRQPLLCRSKASDVLLVDEETTLEDPQTMDGESLGSPLRGGGVASKQTRVMRATTGCVVNQHNQVRTFLCSLL